MKTSTRIDRTEDGWRLSIITINNNVKNTTFIDRLKLIDVIDIADILQLHIENEAELPVKQYRKTA